jgi:FSR family fosmidomycin resistance protein-like MFS transporter
LSEPRAHPNMNSDQNSQLPDVEEERLGTEREVTLAVGHAFHDTYTGFLPPLLPVLISKLAITKTEAGLLSVFLQSPSILQPLIGHLADRVSLRYIVFLGPAITGTMMSLIGIAPSYLSLSLVILVAGISSAGYHAVGPVMVGRLSKRKLGRGMSFWMAGGELGRTLGPIIIVTAIGFLTFQGMPWLMIAGWLASGMLILRLRDVSGQPPEVERSLPWRKALRQMRPLMAPLAGILTVRAFMSAAITIYLPTFLTEEGADLWMAGASLSILEAAGVFGALVGGSLSDRLGRRRVLFLSMLSSPMLLFLFLYFEGWAQISMLPLLGFAGISLTPVIMALVQESFPENRALANGIYMAMSFMIRAVVVILLGVIGDLFGLRYGFIFSGILMLLGMPLILLLPKPKRSAGI